MSVRNIAFFQLLLCGLLALAGCKTPHWFGFADKTAAAPETQLAATQAEPLSSPTPAASEEPEMSPIQKSWRAASGWLTRRPAAAASADERLAHDRSLERQLSNQAIQPRGLPYSNTPGYPTNHASAGNRSAASPADETLLRSTPSLVRRSRRPPPDPAPKLQQDPLLASAAIPHNPPQDPPARTSVDPSPDGIVYRAIQTASHAWRTLPPPTSMLVTGSTVDARDSATAASANEGLKFSAPNLEKIRNSSDMVASTFSQTPSSPEQNSATSDTVPSNGARPDRADTMPRREDLLANQAQPPQTSPANKGTTDGSSVPSTRGKPSSAAVTATEWIAKKSEPALAKPVAATTPSASPPADSARPDNSRSVVADTFAINMFSTPQRSASSAGQPVDTPKSGDESKQLAAVFPMPATDSALPSQAVAGPPNAGGNAGEPPAGPISHQPLQTASTSPQATPTKVSTDRSPGVTGPQANRVATTPMLPAAKTPAAESPDALAARDTLLPTPLPIASPPRSDASHAQQGMSPGQISLARKPSSATPTFSPEVQRTAQSRPVEAIAPLVDADTYRQQLAHHQLAPHQRGWSTAQAGTSESDDPPATGGNWLAAYHRLVGSGAKRQSLSPGPVAETRPGATRRSLSSDDSP